MSKNKDLEKYRKISHDLGLNFIVQQPIEPKEPLLAIVDNDNNGNSSTLTLVSRSQFSKEHKFTWTDEVVSHNNLECQHHLFIFNIKNASLIREVKSCEKALRRTKHGYATINLKPIKKGQAVVIYEGEYKICKDELRSDYSSLLEEEPRLGVSEKPRLDDSVSEETAPKEKVVKIHDGANHFDLELYYSEEDKTSLIVSAKKCRGFGFYMQSLIPEQERNYYRFRPEDESKVAMVNLESAVPIFPIYRAANDIPPLSLLGFNYCRGFDLTLENPYAPFNKWNGLALSYEIVSHHMLLKDRSFNQKYFDAVHHKVSNDEIKKIVEHITINKVYEFNSFYLKEEEKQQILENFTKKKIHFAVEIKNTPDILPIIQAARRSLIGSSLMTYCSFEKRAKIPDVLYKIKLDLLNFKQLEYIQNEKTSKSYDHPELPQWFQFFNYQKLYTLSLKILFETFLKVFEEKAMDNKIEEMIRKYKCGNKEKFPSKQYPVTFRNAAANLQILDLCYLIINNHAADYINSSAENTQKTALHVAVESKKEQNKFATCLLLVECKADPGKILSSNAALTFWFKRFETGNPDPDGIVKKIETEAARLGYSGSFT